MSDFDIIVVGGGMVGAVLAVALDRAGFRVALVEARQPERMADDADYDLRVSAISPASQRLLERLGIWGYAAARRVSPYLGMRVWEGGGSALLEFEHSSLGLPELGHIVENRLIVDGAWAALGGTEVFCPAKLDALNVEPDCVRVRLDDDRELTAALVVGAEGAGSPVRRLSGIRTAGWDYGQRCTVGNVVMEKPHRAIAWQRYIPTGPVAFLPLADGRCSLAWHADEALARELAELDDDAFCDRLTEASGGVLGRAQGVGRRASFPLRLMHATEYVRPRVALAGDAAHVLHPMAGQGVNLGLQDVSALLETLEAAHDPGDARLLRRYQRRRKLDNLAMMAATDALKRVFGIADPAVARLRDRGIALADALAPLKRQMIRQASGE